MHANPATLRPVLISTATHTGAARAAMRTHNALRSAGCDSRFLTRVPAEFPGSVAYQPAKGPLPAVQRFWARLQVKADRHSSLWAYLRNRPLYGKGFATERSWTCDLHHQLNGYNLVNLNSVYRLVDFGSFLPAVAARMPIVWTLQDQQPMTGGCTFDMGCGRYMQQCGHCPFLAKRGNNDLSAISLRRRQRTYQSIPPQRMHIVGPSRWIADLAAKSPLFRRFNVSVIPSGLDLDLYRPIPQEQARAALGLPSGVPVIAYIVENPASRRKGAPVLNKALESLRKEGNVFLLSVGRGEPCRDETSMHLGFITDEAKLAQVYSAADVLVCPSTYDNLPNVVMESLACGTPAVVSDAGGLPEMVTPGKTGEIVPSGNADALARALAQLTARPETLRAMRPACREHAEREYAYALHAQRYLDLYHQLLQ